MAAPRLPFLWPMLARGFEGSSPSVRSARAATRIRAYHATPRRREQSVPQQQRYGTANQPPPHLGNAKQQPPPTQPELSEKKALPKIGEKLQNAGEAEVQTEQHEAHKEAEKKEKRKAAKAGKKASTPTSTPASASAADGTASTQARPDPLLDAAPTIEAPGSPSMLPEKPLETLLDQVPDPSEHSEEQQQQTSSASTPKAAPEDEPEKVFDEHAPSTKVPHISTPLHVHHFDTYSLVNRLKEAGWSDNQAITIMKGVRVMLAQNMDVAQEGLVSKSQVENETYLFRAACAELKTEVTTRRKSEDEKLRTERNQLQHEVEILTQKLGQEAATLKDELKGMFDHRKMAVRNDERSMESKIQRLNYQITVELQADAKSEVEGLRWTITTRAVVGLVFMAVMVVGSLKLASDAAHERELDLKRHGNMKSGGTQTELSRGQSDSGVEGAAAMTGGEILVDSLPTG